jgi:hypothetical protein
LPVLGMISRWPRLVIHSLALLRGLIGLGFDGVPEVGLWRVPQEWLSLASGCLRLGFHSRMRRWWQFHSRPCVGSGTLACFPVYGLGLAWPIVCCHCQSWD